MCIQNNLVKTVLQDLQDLALNLARILQVLEAFLARSKESCTNLARKKTATYPRKKHLASTCTFHTLNFPFLARNLQDLQESCKSLYVSYAILNKSQESCKKLTRCKSESCMENDPFLAAYQESCKIFFPGTFLARSVKSYKKCILQLFPVRFFKLR